MLESFVFNSNCCIKCTHKSLFLISMLVSNQWYTVVPDC